MTEPDTVPFDLADADSVSAVVAALGAGSGVRALSHRDGTFTLVVPRSLARTVVDMDVAGAASAARATRLRRRATELAASLAAATASHALPSGASVLCDCTPQTLVNLGRLAAWGAASPTAERAWIDNHAGVTTVTGADAVALDAAVAARADAIWVALASALSGLAGGSVTAASQVDAAFAHLQK